MGAPKGLNRRLKMVNMKIFAQQICPANYIPLEYHGSHATTTSNNYKLVAAFTEEINREQIILNSFHVAGFPKRTLGILTLRIHYYWISLALSKR